VTAPPWLAPLVDAVQRNNDIADARHAADLPLCIYLLQMREYYRWTHRLPWTASLDRGAVGGWLAEREARWAALEDADFAPLPLPRAPLDALAVDEVNAELVPQGFLYGAGAASVARESFFVAELQRRELLDDGATLLVCGREWARALFAPPAVLAGGERPGGGTIILRRESMARWLWEKFEAFGAHRSAGAFAALAEHYRLDDGAAFATALGELHAARWLEPGWSAMRRALTQRRTELQVRALRDQLADCELTLPVLAERGAAAPLHFWFANYDGLREQLFPGLAGAYRAWRAGAGVQPLRRAAEAGARHFRELAEQVLALHDGLGAAAEPAIARLLAAPQAVCAADGG
jgi:hypothetical protein